MDAILYCCCFLLTTIALFSHDVLDITTASISPKLALSSCLFCVTSLQPSTYIPVLHPDPGYFLSLNEITVTGLLHNGFKDRPHRHARKIKLDTRCRLGMSVQPESCHSDEYPCLHMLQFLGFQSPMCQNIYNTCTSLSAIAHSFCGSQSDMYNNDNTRTKLRALTDFFASVPKPTLPCSAFDAMFTSKQRSIFNYPKLYTDLRALTGSLLLSLKVEEMPAALDSFDVFRIYGMMKLVAERLGVNITTMLYFKLANTAHHSGVSCATGFSVLLSLMKDSPGVATITQLRSNMGLFHSTVHSFVDVLWRPPTQSHIHAAEHVQSHSTIHTDDMRAITNRAMAVREYFNAHFDDSPSFGAGNPEVHEFLGLTIVKKVLNHHIIQIEVSSPKIVVKLREEEYSVERIPHPIPLNWVHSVKRYASDDSCNRHKARLCYGQSFTRYIDDDKWSPMTKPRHHAVDACADVPSRCQRQNKVHSSGSVEALN